MIDIKLIRYSKEIVRQSEIKRFRDPQIVDTLYELDRNWIQVRKTLDDFNRKMNLLQKGIKDFYKKNKKSALEEEKDLIQSKLDNLMGPLEFENFKEIIQDLTFPELINVKTAFKSEKEKLTLEVETLEKEISEKLATIGNIIHADVKVSKDEAENPVIRVFETNSVNFEKKKPYAEILSLIDGCDTLRGSRIAGHRGYFLFEDFALLGMSLARYAIDFMRIKGYRLCQTPQFMTTDSMAKTAQLGDFDDQLYSIGDAYLIATSEQPLTALYMDEILVTLPIKFVGHSICYRKEAGAHGKDNQGIFRVHQFEKVEQFVICAEDESEAMFHRMIEIVEELYKSLNLPYRVVSIVSGELNDAASIKYDLEGWFPTRNEYRELVSCSNCTDYQSRSLNVRHGYGNECKFVHMLNCTVVAVQRMLCCLIENYQVEDGIVVPEVLREYMKVEKIFYRKN